MKKSFTIIAAVLTVSISFATVSCGKKKNEKVYVPVSPEHFQDDGSASSAESAEVIKFTSPFRRTIENEITERPSDSSYSASCLWMYEKVSAGYFVKPVKGECHAMYSWPSKENASVVGTFPDNHTGVLLDVYILDNPIPVNDAYCLVRNLDTGIEGWIYTNTEEIKLKFSAKNDSEKTDNERAELVNASVTKKIVQRDYKSDNFEISSDGEKYAVLKDSNIEVYNVSDEEPFVVIEGTKFTPRLTENTIAKFSSDNKNLYILHEEGNLYSFNFEEGATTKLWTFNFDEQGAGFKEPRIFAVTPDNRFFYLKASMDSSSRCVPRVLVYDSKKEKQYYFDIRGSKDPENGYYYYGDFQMLPDGNVLLSMFYDDRLAVKFYVNNDDELTYSKTEFNDSRIDEIIYDPYSKDYILIKEKPFLFEKVSSDPKSDDSDSLRKYGYDPFPNKAFIDREVITNYKKGIFAVCYVDCRNNAASIYFYSLKTLNLLYSYEAQSYSGSVNGFSMKWADSRLLYTWRKDNKFDIAEVDIKEKEKQMSLVYDWDERIDHFCAAKPQLVSEDYLFLYASFTPQGSYYIYSMDDRDFDSMVLESVDGKFDFASSDRVVLYQAGNGKGPALEEGDEAMERLYKRLMSIPVLRDKGTLNIDVEECSKESWETGEEQRYRLMSDLGGK